MNTLLTTRDGEPQENVDTTLRDFFVSEMPSPWPHAKALDTLPMQPVWRPQRSWLQRHGRLALAASILLMLLSYLTLASSFPRDNGNGAALDQTGPMIGDRPRLVLPPQRSPRMHGKTLETSGEIIPGAPGEGPAIIIHGYYPKGSK